MSGNILICGVNWIGDTVMSMPAIQAFRGLHPSARIALLIKPALRPLWSLHDVPDDVIDIQPGAIGTLRTAARVRERGPFARAYILPHSIRSALIPRLAGVPERIGMPGHFRDPLLTEVIPPAGGPGRDHQVYEYLDLLTPEERGKPWTPPRLQVPDDERALAEELVRDLNRPLVALIPGAARGPSKQWPAEHFVALGQRLSKERACGIMVLGAPAERDLCGAIADAIGASARNLAGRTEFTQWAALLQIARLVVANDSGGMHVAAALGAPVLALYGVTDPTKTGPLSSRARVLQQADSGHRDVARASEAARNALAAITPQEAYDVALDLLDAGD